MAQPLLRLYPGRVTEVPLPGAFLGHDLRQLGAPAAGFVYTGFITSLDGRVAEPDPVTGLRGVPRNIANARDWRLFLELVAQADVMLVSDRLLSAFAKERYLQLWDLAGPGLDDLIPWRRQQGLPDRPAVAAVSPWLTCSLPAGAVEREVLLLAPDEAPADRARTLTEQGGEVLRLGPGPTLTGDALVAALVARGHSVICSVAGPQVAHTLVTSGHLGRLYLTLAHCLVGGEAYDSLLKGPRLEAGLGFDLSALYWDSASSPGQIVQVLDAVSPPSPSDPQ